MLAATILTTGCKRVEVQVEEREDGLFYKSGETEPFTGDGLVYHTTGKPAQEGQFQDGKQTGLWTTWYVNGQKESEGNWADGIRNGPWTLWHDNRQKKWDGVFKDGSKDGLCTQWNASGIKLFEEEWKDGKQTAIRKWDEEGNQVEPTGKEHNSKEEVKEASGAEDTPSPE